MHKAGLMIINVILFSDNGVGNNIVFALPIIIFHAFLMLGLPYVYMRSSASRMTRELEREFFYMNKDITPYDNIIIE